jgi:hypothetical protein
VAMTSTYSQNVSSFAVLIGLGTWLSHDGRFRLCGVVKQFLANGVQLCLNSVDHTRMDVIQYSYTVMSTSRFLMVQRY